MRRRTRRGPHEVPVVTFGCRVNQADSLEMEGVLRARGAVGVAPADADVVIVNTCSVTAAADQGARQAIRRVARVNPSVQIVVTGCYATRAPGDVASLPNVARVVRNPRKESLASELADAFGLTTADRFGPGEGPCGAALEPGVAGRTALTLRVQTGCDERCSYCIIPSTRGTGRSKPLAEMRTAVERAAAAGYREIALTGVHLGSYGRDLGDGSSLLALVRLLAEWPADVLFRLSSLEPMDCSPELVRSRGGVATAGAAFPSTAAARVRRDARRRCDVRIRWAYFRRAGRSGFARACRMPRSAPT